MTASLNARQRSDGSVPRISSRSRSAAGTCAAWNVFDGQSITRVRPSTSLMVGRTAVKSKNSSGSISATSLPPKSPRISPSAAEAASPASFQPLNAHTSTGSRSCGRLFHRMGSIHSTVPGRVRLRPDIAHA